MLIYQLTNVITIEIDFKKYNNTSKSVTITVVVIVVKVTIL